MFDYLISQFHFLPKLNLNFGVVTFSSLYEKKSYRGV